MEADQMTEWLEAQLQATLKMIAAHMWSSEQGLM